MNVAVNKEIKLAEEHIKAIEKCLNHQGTPEVIIRRENGKIIVLRSEKKRII